MALEIGHHTSRYGKDEAEERLRRLGVVTKKMRAEADKEARKRDVSRRKAEAMVQELRDKRIY